MRRRIALWLALAVVGAWLGCDETPLELRDAAVADLAPPSPPPNRILSAADGGVAEVGPMMVAGPGHQVALAWVSLRAGGIGVDTALSGDDGVTYLSAGSAPLAPGEQASDPSMAISAAGEIHLTYLTITAGQAQAVWHTRWDVASGQWAARTRVDDGTPVVRDAPWLGIAPDGALLIVYREEPANVLGRLMVARSDDDGITFVPRLLGMAGNVAVLAIDDSARVHIAYVDAALDVHYARSLDGGRTFSAPTPPLGRSETPIRARLAVRGSTVYLSYLDVLPAVMLLRSQDGVSFSATRVLSGPVARASFFPTVALPGTRRVAVGFYLAPDQIRGRFAAAFSDDDGATFSAPVLVSDADLRFNPDRNWPDWLGDYQQLVPVAGGLLAAFTDNRLGPSHIFLALLPP